MTIAKRLARNQCAPSDLLHDAFIEVNRLKDKFNVTEAIQNGRGVYYLTGMMRGMMQDHHTKSRQSFFNRTIKFSRVTCELPKQDIRNDDAYQSMVWLDCVDTIVACHPAYYGKLWHVHFDLGYSLPEISAETGINIWTLRDDYFYIKKQVKDELERCVACN